MAENNYTEEELAAAKEYLRLRLRNEKSMSADVIRLLEMYAAYLLTALFGNASNNDIELLINDLINELLSDVELLAVDEHDRKDLILVYMNGERGGDTLEGRVSKRCRTFFDEVFAVYTAGKLMNLNYATLLSSIKANLDNPYDNEILVTAREKQKRGEFDASYVFSAPHLGRGVEVSSKGALDRMLGHAIADAWTFWQYEDASARGAKGYHVVRGSSYPCEHCDEAAASFHPMDDTEHLVPLHLNCVCYIVYSYVERL